jgi:hypothetical protein
MARELPGYQDRHKTLNDRLTYAASGARDEGDCALLESRHTELRCLSGRH